MLLASPEEHQTFMIGEEFFEVLALFSVLVVWMILIR